MCSVEPPTPVIWVDTKKRTKIKDTNSSITHAETSNPGVTKSEDISPFWSSSKCEMSKCLWSPIKNDDLISQKIALNVSPENSANYSTWFNVLKFCNSGSVPDTKISSNFVENLWPRTLLSNEHFTNVEIGVKNNVLVGKPVKELGQFVKSTKIRLSIKNEKDIDVLGSIFGTVRWTYNKCVDYMNRVQEKPTKKRLRSLFVNNTSETVRTNEWLTNVSYDIRDDSVSTFISAIKGNATKVRNGDVERFRMKFKSKKRQKSETFYLRRQWVVQTKNAIILRLPNVAKPVVLWSGKRAWRGDILMDCRLQRTNTGKYYLCIPHESGVDNQDPPKNLRVCSLDPGVRTFQTIYDPTNNCAYQVAPQDINKIVRLCIVLDKVISKQTKSKPVLKYRLKRVERRLRLKIRNLVEELHKQLAKYLSSQYDLIIIPKFETSQMVKKGQRKISSRSVRQMMCWAHYRFRERLLFKSRENGAKVAVVDESWTSKTCSCCGKLDHNLGGKKTYTCRYCSAIIDRDINGAKNILLKNHEALALVADKGAYPPQ